MTLEAVQAHAGHVSIESTRIYLHLTNDWLAREYRQASRLIDAGHAEELLALEVINSEEQPRALRKADSLKRV